MSTSKQPKYRSTIQDEVPEKDLKLSSSSSSNSRSNSSSRSSSRMNCNSSSKMDNMELKKTNLTESYSSLQHQQLDNNNLNPLRHHYNHQATNSNLLNRHYSSQIDIPIAICNSTTIGAQNLLANRNGSTQYLYNNTNSTIGQTMVNYPQQATHLYSNHPQYHHTPAMLSSTTISNYDRMLSNRMSAISMTQPTASCIYEQQPMYTSQNPYVETQIQHPTAFSVLNQLNQPVHDSLLRRDTEIERLRMRIVLLEQQLDTPSCSAAKSAQNSNEMKLNNLEFEAAVIRMEMNSNVSKDEHIHKLEQMLNAKEYDIEELEKKHKETSVRYEKELTKQAVLLNTKEEEQLKDKNKQTSLQKENDKLQSKLNECNDYISRLPTLDEVNEKEEQFNKLESEVSILKAKLTEQEKKCTKAKEYIRNKTNDIKDLEQKLKTANLEIEKVQIEFNVYKRATQEVGDLMNKVEENAHLVAENQMNKKVINALQEGQKSLKSQYDKQLDDLNNKLNCERNLIETLEKTLDAKDRDTSKLEQSVKKISNENQLLMEENLNLTEKLKTLNTAMSQETLKYLYSLFKELNLCTQELNELVNNCIDLQNGKPVDVNSLLGYSEASSYNTFDVDVKEHGMLSLMESEYLLNKTSEIKRCRKRLADVRQNVSNEYADKLGSNVSCMTQ